MFGELVFDADAVVYFSFKHVRAYIFHFIAALHFPGHFIAELTSSKHKLINHGSTKDPKPITNNMYTINTISSNIGIKIEYNFAIVATSSNMHTIGKEE